ncbi:sigma intracellular receptor 2 [Athene cunicularia]|uniref:Transmembrane protein 97 n=1 Tax=Athene cunicularia TaxID=194338 RepID=A0A663M8R7_ATHCN|nr:sigma intracellular receptor 2 [Athene cunicularia]
MLEFTFLSWGRITTPAFPSPGSPTSPRCQRRVAGSAPLPLTPSALICCSVLFLKLTELLEWYTSTFRDPLMLQPPAWFKAFMYCEAVLQLPFFPVAVYAFLKGGCRWIRTPAIIYSTHAATTLFAILAHILFHDFSPSEQPGPQTQRERLTLLSVYVPYLLIPLLILVTMLYHPHYNHVEKRKRK